MQAITMGLVMMGLSALTSAGWLWVVGTALLSAGIGYESGLRGGDGR